MGFVDLCPAGLAVSPTASVRDNNNVRDNAEGVVTGGRWSRRRIDSSAPLYSYAAIVLVGLAAATGS